MFRKWKPVIAAASILWSTAATAQTPQPAKPPAQDTPDAARSARPKVPLPNRRIGPEVASEIPVTVYRARRQALIAGLGACAAVVPASHADGSALAESYFYLTGDHTSGAALLLSPRQVAQQTLIAPARDASGTPLDVHARALMRTELAVDQVVANDADGKAASGQASDRAHGRAIDRTIDRAIDRAVRQSRCYASLQPSLDDNPALPKARLHDLLEAVDGHIQQKWQFLEAMRARKDEHELARMQKAAAIAIFAHESGARALRRKPSERDLASTMDRAVRSVSGAGLPVESRVASGPRAAQLTWSGGQEPVAAGQLVVLEGTASYGGYAARVVRTYPASGAFSSEQKSVYDTAVAAHEKAITTIRSGVSLARIRRVAESALEDAGYRATRTGSRGTPFADGHFIGLSVRDVGNPDAPLDAGMVVVVETGVLIRGTLAVRMADMVLVTPRGQRLLTADLPRSQAGITAWLKKVQ